jgi:hypothetical protein
VSPDNQDHVLAYILFGYFCLRSLAVVLSAEVFCQRWLVVGIIFLSYSVSLPNCKQDANGDV